MPRQRSPAREKAKKLYLKAKGKAVLKDIASKLGVLDTQIRKWKSLDKWDDQLKGTLPNIIKERPIRNVAIKIKKLEVKKEKIIAESKLTEKQKLFCLCYIKNFNATQAAIKAGFSEKYPSETGYGLLQKITVRNEITRLKELKKQSIMIGEDDIVELKIRIAFADITDFMVFGTFDALTFSDTGIVTDEKGVPIMHKENNATFKQSDIVDGSLISEIKTSRQGASLKLIDKQKALDWLADYFDMNPVNKYRKEFDSKKLQLERERFDHLKIIDELKEW